MHLAHVLCLVGILFSPMLFTVYGNSSQGDDLYNSTKKEKRMMMLWVSYSMFTPETKCRDSCVEGVSDRKDKENKCHCDKQCVAFGDCCLDYWESCNSSFTAAYNKDEIFKCTRPILYLSSNATITENQKNLGVQVATKCPATFTNSKTKNSCESPEAGNENVLPFVQGSDGQTYRNKFCAECNGIMKYTLWNTELACLNSTMQWVKQKLAEKDYSFTSEERKKIRESCMIKMAAPGGAKGVPCKIVTECENTQSSDYLKCKLYKLQVYQQIPPRTFKNPHCAKCNGVFLGLLSAREAPSHQGRQPPSLALLFDFTKGSQIYGLKEITIRHTCEPGKVYDFKLKLCRQQRILKTPKFSNWTCAYFNETFPNSTEYLTIFENESIYVIAHDKLYSQGEYLWHEGNVTVCGNLTVTYLKTTMERLGKLYSKAEYFITIVGLSLSILALLIVIVTYLLFSELRSKLPGKIVINLAAALMMAQLVFLVDMFSDIKGKGCVAIAVFLQFLYLAAFCWMNVMAFDVSRTFAGKSHRSPSGSRNKVFVLSLIYAWGLPLVITGLTLIVHHSGAMDVSYGKTKCQEP
ncbi:uncharacterized protein LOC114522998 [Dendronephthya gigantea]|uniref:uncharacterized protein LOC114522998 n=1 Tax=Dendronephthya gigantea TaxID=151771 RepID=UPI00106A1FBD|nr:uncharacterized protein LOC114522998 [Dendronephthya gigantea]